MLHFFVFVFVLSASRLVGKQSCQLTVLSANCPVGELSCRRTALSANCPVGKLSCRRNVRWRTNYFLCGYSFTKSFLWMTSEKKSFWNGHYNLSMHMKTFHRMILTPSYIFGRIWPRRYDRSLDTLDAVWCKWLRRYDTHLALRWSVMKMEFDTAIRVRLSELS